MHMHINIRVGARDFDTYYTYYTCRLDVGEDSDKINTFTSSCHHVQIQEFLSGGGGGPGPTARKQPGQRFYFSSQLFYSLQRGSNGLITE